MKRDRVPYSCRGNPPVVAPRRGRARGHRPYSKIEFTSQWMKRDRVPYSCRGNPPVVAPRRGRARGHRPYSKIELTSQLNYHEIRPC